MSVFCPTSPAVTVGGNLPCFRNGFRPAVATAPPRKRCREDWRCWPHLRPPRCLHPLRRCTRRSRTTSPSSAAQPFRRWRCGAPPRPALASVCRRVGESAPRVRPPRTPPPSCARAQVPETPSPCRRSGTLTRSWTTSMALTQGPGRRCARVGGRSAMRTDTRVCVRAPHGLHPQRYFVNTSFFDGSGPVFLCVGERSPSPVCW